MKLTEEQVKTLRGYADTYAVGLNGSRHEEKFDRLLAYVESLSPEVAVVEWQAKYVRTDDGATVYTGPTVHEANARYLAETLPQGKLFRRTLGSWEQVPV